MNDFGSRDFTLSARARNLALWKARKRALRGSRSPPSKNVLRVSKCGSCEFEAASELFYLNDAPNPTCPICTALDILDKPLRSIPGARRG